MTEERKTQLEKELTEKFGSKVSISIEKSDKDYSKDPFFVKIVNRKIYGFSKELYSRKQRPFYCGTDRTAKNAFY